MLRIAESTGRTAVVAQLTTSGAQESVGTSFVHLAARANGAPLAQATPTVGPDPAVRVILAPDARGPLPPAVTLPSGQLPASVAASAVSLTPVPLQNTANGAIAGQPGSTTANPGYGASPNGGVTPLSANGVPSSAIPLLSNAAGARPPGSTAGAASGPNASTAGTASGGSGRILPSNPPTPNGLRLSAIAQAQVGAKYTWAGVSPATGFDCSGFVYYVYNAFGYSLPRLMEDQLASGRRVRLEELRAGDILFYADTYTAGLSHNGIYLGDGKFIHAVDESTGVAITPVNSSYWDQRFVAAVRVVE
jgi:cell wall-associated NlpC family hydrolase